jgi:hypothetical protein
MNRSFPCVLAVLLLATAIGRTGEANPAPRASESQREKFLANSKALFDSIGDKDVAAVRRLLKQDPDLIESTIPFTEPCGISPLHDAALQGSAEMIDVSWFSEKWNLARLWFAHDRRSTGASSLFTQVHP